MLTCWQHKNQNLAALPSTTYESNTLNFYPIMDKKLGSICLMGFVAKGFAQLIIVSCLALSAKAGLPHQ